jgi:hyperosmotically inducible protein
MKPTTAANTRRRKRRLTVHSDTKEASTRTPTIWRPKFLFSSLSLLFCALLTVSIGIGYVAAQQAPDNTGQNKDQTNPTADNQKMNPADREMTQKLRQSIYQDKTLSTYAHNIKIISHDGKVTIRGPVRSEDEKNNLQAKAVAVAGEGNVTNELQIAPSK